MTDDYKYRIKSRIAEIELEIRRIQGLEDELEELRVAARVLDRFGNNGDVDKGDLQESRKPSIGNQIIDILTMYGPLKASLITQKLDELRGGETRRLTVNVTLSRLKAAGRIDYDGKRWFAVKKNEISPVVAEEISIADRGHCLSIESRSLKTPG
ncbi:MAG: hypothetical protein ABL951_12160 [Alphaproteobacteria bacterium]